MARNRTIIEDLNGNATVTGSLTAASIIKTGGTSSQYLMADGSVSTLSNPTTGTGTTNYIAKYTGSTTLGNSQIFDNGTNVGIGTTGAGAKLTIVQTAAAEGLRVDGASGAFAFVVNAGTTNTVNIRSGLTVGVSYISTTPPSNGAIIEGDVGIGATTPYSYTNMRFVTTQGSAGGGLSMNVGSTLVGQIYAASGGVDILSAGSRVIRFYTNSNERMLIHPTGNVSIGNSSDAGYKLDVFDGTARVYGSVLRVEQGSGFQTAIALNQVGLRQWTIRNIATSGLFGINDGSFDRLVIDGSTGNVGIGTSSPGYLLDIKGSGNYLTRIENSVGTSAATLFFSNTSGQFYIGNDSSNGSAVSSTAYARLIWGQGAYPLVLATNNTERMRITSSGSVGIGTTSPGAKLQVVGDALFGGDATYNNVFVTNNSTTGGGAFTIQQNGVNRGQFAVSGGWLGDTSSDTAITSIAPNIRFYTNNSVNERMRIDGSGNVGIGTTSPSYLLQVGSASTSGSRQIMLTDSDYGLLLTGGGGNSIIQSRGVTVPLVFQSSNNNSGDYHFTSTGKVGIGTTSPIGKLDVVSGYIRAGSAASTSGSKILWGNYSDGALTTFGSMYSSGGPVIGYGVSPSISTEFSFVSSTGIAISRGAYYITGGNHYWYAGASQTVAVDGAVTMTNTMVLNSSGNLGIGTTSPAQKLEIRGDGNQWIRINNQNNAGAIAGVQLFANNTYRSALYFDDNAGTTYLSSTVGTNQLISIISGSTLNLEASGANIVTYRTNGNERMRITAAGDVGIGTTSPAVKLEVSGVIRGTRLNSTGGVVDFDAQTGNNFIQVASNIMSFANGSAVNMTIAANGNVGIGTTSPSEILDIRGARRNQNSGEFNQVIYSTTAQSPGYGGSIGFGGNILLSGTSLTTFGGIVGAKENSTDNNTAGYLAFYTRVAGGPIQEKVRITSTGNVLVGTTTDQGSTFQVSGNSYLSNGRVTIDSNHPFGISLTRSGPIAQQIYTGTSWIIIGVETTAGGLFTGSSTNASIVGSGGSTPLQFGTNSIIRATIDNSGVVTVNNLAGTGTRMVVANASGVLSTQAIPTGTVSGSGTLNYVPKWTPDGSTLGNSQIFDNGTNVGIATTSPGTKLDVNGTIRGTIISVNTSGQSQSISTYYGANSNGNNIYAGGGGNNSIGEVGATYKGSENSSYGFVALQSVTTGSSNSAFGAYTLQLLTTGENNIAVGGGVLSVLTTASDNTAVGYISGGNLTTGSRNTAIGSGAGRFINAGTANQTSANSIYLGYDSRASANGNTNEIVIGYQGRGNGSNTTTIGNSSTVSTFIPAGRTILAGTTDIGTYALQVNGSIYNTTGAVFAATSGNVGVGVASPAFKLDVSGTMRAVTNSVSSVMADRSAFANTSGFALSSTSSTRFSWNLVASTDNSQISDAAGNSILYFTQSGNVGIGTTSPGQKLEVAGIGRFTDSTAFSIGGDGGRSRMQYDSTNTTFRILTSGDSYAAFGGRALSIGASYGGNAAPTSGMIVEGNVGIGTTAPTRKVEINGYLRVNDTIAGAGYIYGTSNDIILGQDGPSGVNIYVGDVSNAITNSHLYVMARGLLRFYTNGNEQMRITSAGDVVIGSSTVDPFSRNDERRVNIDSTAISSTANVALSLNSGASAGRGAQIYMGGGGTRHFTLSANATETTIGTVSNTPFRINTNDSTKIYVSAIGNVGVGTTSPAYKLDITGDFRTTTGAILASSSGTVILGTSSATSDNEMLQVDGNGRGGNIYTAMFRNTNTANTVYNSTRWTQGQVGTAVGYVGTGGSAVGNTAFRNNFVVGTQNSSALVFNTNDLERMRITSNGEVLVGTTTVTSPYIMTVAGAVYVNNTPTFSSGGNIATNLSNTITILGSSTFNSGSIWSPLLSSNYVTINANNTIPNSVTVAGQVNVNRISFSATSSTITMTQGSGSAIRAIAAQQVLQQTGGTINGTISHGTSLLVQGVYPTNTANVTYTNYYGLVVNPLDEWGGVTMTNRWGIYQAGSSDRNYFSGKVLINTTTETGSHRLVVSGTTLTSSITTDAPSSGTAQPWKLGSVVNSTVQLDGNRYVEVEINGTSYRLGLITLL